jgi:nitrogen fixation/metabolism regulation signal transduction histidine kinase
VVQKSSGFVRKHVFIDRKFQGRYMVTFLVPLVVLLLFMVVTIYMVSQTIVNTTVRIIKSDVENTIAMKLQDQQNPSVQSYQAVLMEIRAHLSTFTNNKELRKSFLVSLLWVFGIGLLIVIIQIVYLTIYFSHRIAGPVYRFEKVCHNVIDGIYTDQIRLRKGDEMQNLAVLLNEAIKLTRERMIELGDSKECGDSKKIISL